MASILKVRNRVAEFNPEIAASAAMQACENDLNDINLEQLYDGKTKMGTDIRPSYLEDPYFKTQKQALAYAAWKNRITPNPRRGEYTPNLLINGYYYRNRQVQVLIDRILYLNTYAAFGDKFPGKYEGIDGLGGNYKKMFIKDYLRPSWMNEVRGGLKL